MAGIGVNTIAEKVKKYQPNQAPTKTYQIKVMDFTFRNGLKFGIGFTVGSMAVYGAVEFIRFIFYMMSEMGMPGI